MFYTAVECPEPNAYDHSKIKAKGRKYQENTEYTCVVGYSLDPTNPSDNTFSVTCEKNAEWTTPSRTCQSKLVIFFGI